jgi:hypothetical protein
MAGQPNRDIRQEAAIHHVNVDPIRSCVIDGANLFGETTELCRRD